MNVPFFPLTLTVITVVSESEYMVRVLPDNAHVPDEGGHIVPPAQDEVKVWLPLMVMEVPTIDTVVSMVMVPVRLPLYWNTACSNMLVKFHVPTISASDGPPAPVGELQPQIKTATGSEINQKTCLNFISVPP